MGRVRVRWVTLIPYLHGNVYTVEQKDPLQFFIDIADENPIKPYDTLLIGGLSHGGRFWTDEESGETIDLSEGFDDLSVEYVQPQPYWQNSYFTSHLPTKLQHQVSASVNDIDSMLSNMADLGSVFTKLTELMTSMDSVVNRLSERQGAQQYPEIFYACEDLLMQLESRKKRIVSGKENAGTKKLTPAKIQWLGQVNVLGTLFYHLLKGQDGGPPYIAGSVEQVKRMLVDNFVDSEGHELSKGTLDTILMPSRAEKRANVGDRIEFPNKKPK